MVQFPPAIIFVNNDLTAQVEDHIVKQLFIDLVLTGDQFDATLSADPDYRDNIISSGRRALVIRPFNTIQNRDYADALIFVKNGLACVETNKVGPPGKTFPVINLHLTQILDMF